MTGIWEEKIVTEREGRAAQLIVVLIILVVVALIVGFILSFSSPSSEASSCSLGTGFIGRDTPYQCRAFNKGQVLPKSVRPAPAFTDLLDAIEWVESKGDANAIGDGGKAVGAYQIHKIYVDDCNRILGKNKYTYADRWDRDKSREITAIVIQHYGDGNFETMARTHKSPPKRYKDYTKAYWLKVKAGLEGLR